MRTLRRCPRCQGGGYTVEFACPRFHPVKRPCEPCHGLGKLTDADAQRIVEAWTLRDARIEAGISLRRAARRLSLSLAEYSAIELPNPSAPLTPAEAMERLGLAVVARRRREGE